MNKIFFESIDWIGVEKIKTEGKTGTAVSQSKQLDGITIRIVTYSANYLADHWCSKGHFVHCLEGDFVLEMEDGKKYPLSKGMSFIVSDNLSSHRSISKNGAQLLILDGNFLESK